MKKLAAITLTSMMLLLATAMVVGAVENVVRGARSSRNLQTSPGIHRTSPASTTI